MANQLQVIDLNAGALALPEHLQNMPTIVGPMSQGDTRNRIGLKGREFHVFKGGIEEGVLETKYADVVIVGAYPHISRNYYDKAYEDNVAAAPVCYSTDGKTPSANASIPQSDKCETCPQNQKGSSIAGGEKSKACGFLRRIAVILVGDPEFTVFSLDLKSMSIWDDDREGKGHNGKFSFTNYAKKLAAHHIDPGKVITRLTFTADSVPALQFQAIGYVDAEQVTKIVELVESDAIKPALNMELGNNATDTTPAIPAPQIAAPKAPAPRVAAPQPAPAARVAPPAPKPVPARPAAVPARPVPAPAPRIAPRIAAPIAAPLPPEQTEDEVAAAHPAMQPTKIMYGQRRAPQAPLVTKKATAAEVQQDVDALIAELDG